MMEFNRSNTSWIAAAAALTGAAAYLFSTRMQGRMLPGETEARMAAHNMRGRRSSDSAGSHWSIPRMRARMTPNNVFVIEKTSEVARMAPGRALAGVATLAGVAWLMSRRGESTSDTEVTVDVNVPVSTAYNQFTQFEEFPRFMATVQEVKQIDDSHLHWRALVAGKEKEWDAEITEQIPDRRIAWRSTSGPRNEGVVDFENLGANRTRVKLKMTYEPESVDEKIGDALGGVKLTAKGNLAKFKQLVEARGVETGAWRGTIAKH
jgi:uncharacterized membrane protein